MRILRPTALVKNGRVKGDGRQRRDGLQQKKKRGRASQKEGWSEPSVGTVTRAGEAYWLKKEIQVGTSQNFG